MWFFRRNLENEMKEILKRIDKLKYFEGIWEEEIKDMKINIEWFNNKYKNNKSRRR